MAMTEHGNNFYNRTIRFKENLLSVLDYDGFPHKFPSDYNWLMRQRSSYRSNELNKEYKMILDTYLPGWNLESHEMLTAVRKQRLVEMAEHGYPEIGELMRITSPDDAYIMAKLGFGSINSIIKLPCNVMFLKSDYFNSLTNCIYQRSMSGDYNLSTRVQHIIFRLAQIQYPRLTKEVLAAYWILRESSVTNQYMGRNLYLFNFMAISSSQEYCGVTVSNKLMNITADREVVDFANRYKKTLTDLCNCFTNREWFNEIVSTSEFKKMYNEIRGKTSNIMENNSAETHHTINRTVQAQIKKESKPAKTGGIFGLMNMFSRKSEPEYSSKNDITVKKLKPKGPSGAAGDGVGPTAGDEYNTGYVGSTSSGSSGGHSFGEYMAAAGALGLLGDNNDDDDGDID